MSHFLSTRRGLPGTSFESYNTDYTVSPFDFYIDRDGLSDIDGKQTPKNDRSDSGADAPDAFGMFTPHRDTRRRPESPTLGQSSSPHTSRSPKSPNVFDENGDSSAKPVSAGFRFYHYGPEWAVGSTSLPMAQLNLLNIIIGVGLFDLAESFQWTGIPLGIIILTISAVTTRYSLYLMHKLSVITRQLSYGQIALKIGGPYFCIAIDILIATEMFTFVSSFLTVVRDFLQADLESTEESFSKALFQGKGFPLIICLVAVASFILCNISKADNLKISAVAAIIYILILVSLTMIKVSYVSKDTLNSYAKQPPMTRTIDAIPMIIFALNCNLQFMPIYNELPQPVPDITAEKLTSTPVAVSYLLYILLGTLGSVLSSSKVALAIALLVKFPIMTNAGFKSIQFLVRIFQTENPIAYLAELQNSESVIINASPPPRSLLAISSAIILVLSTVLVSVSETVDNALGLAGILITIPLSFIIPPYLFMASFQQISLRERLYPFLLITFGLVVFFVTITGACLYY